MSFTIAWGRSRLATVTSSSVRGSSVARPHESTPRTPRASSRITRIVRSTSRLAVTARPASRSARVSRARRTLSSKSRALWIAIPACSPNASSTRWWCAVNAPGRVANAEMTPITSPASLSGTQSIERIPSRSSTSRRAERGSVRTSSTRIAVPPVAFREEPSQLDRRRERPAELADDLDVLVVEGSRASRGQRHGAEDATSRQEWHQRHGAVAALRKDPPAHLGDPSLANVVHPEWRAARHELGEQGPGEGHPIVPRHAQGHGARDDVDDLELVALDVDERHGDRVEGHELRHRLGEGVQHVVERVGRDEESRELVQHCRAERAPVEAPDAVERLAEGPRDVDRQNAACE